MQFLIYLIIITCCLSVGAQESPTRDSVPLAAPSSPVAPLAIDLHPDTSGTVPQEQIRELLRFVAEKDIENEKRLRDYTYVQREEQHKLDGKGNVKKVESRTSEVLVVYGEHIERLIEKDDKPLSAEEAKKE